MSIVAAVFRFKWIVIGADGFVAFRVLVPYVGESGFSISVWSPVGHYIAVLWD